MSLLLQEVNIYNLHLLEEKRTPKIVYNQMFVAKGSRHVGVFASLLFFSPRHFFISKHIVGACIVPFSSRGKSGLDKIVAPGTGNEFPGENLGWINVCVG